MPLNSPDFTTLVRILERFSGWQREDDRRALLDEALWESPRKHDIAGQLDLSGGPHNAAVRAVSRLSQFGQDIAGRDVCCLLIAALNRNVGHDEQADLRAISHRLNCPLQVDTSIKGDHAMLPPELVTMSVPFLFEIGRWAKSELSEIWKLRRKQQEIELAKAETQDTKAAVEEILRDAAANVGDNRVSTVLEYIKEKRGLIDDLKQAKNTHENELNKQLLSENAFKLRIRDANDRIKKHLDDIAAELASIGIDADRTT